MTFTSVVSSVSEDHVRLQRRVGQLSTPRPLPRRFGAPKGLGFSTLATHERPFSPRRSRHPRRSSPRKPTYVPRGHHAGGVPSGSGARDASNRRLGVAKQRPPESDRIRPWEKRRQRLPTEDTAPVHRMPLQMRLPKKPEHRKEERPSNLKSSPGASPVKRHVRRNVTEVQRRGSERKRGPRPSVTSGWTATGLLQRLVGRAFRGVRRVPELGPLRWVR